MLLGDAMWPSAVIGGNIAQQWAISGVSRAGRVSNEEFELTASRSAAP